MKLLVIRFSAMGDVAMVLPTVHAFLNEYKNSEIYLISKNSYASIFQSIPRLHFISFDANQYKGILGLYFFCKYVATLAKFNAIIDLHNSLRSRMIRLFFSFKKVPFFVVNKGKNDKNEIISKTNKSQKILPHHTQRYADVFDLFTKSNLKLTTNIPFIHTENKPLFDAKFNIGIAPLAAHSLKEWQIENYKSLIISILSEYIDCDIYLFGGHKDIEKLQTLLISPKVKLATGLPNGLKSELEYISKLDIMICNDSGNMHLAAMLGTKVIAIFGPTHPNLGFGPFLQDSNILQDNTLICRPCTVYGNVTCYRGDYACMINITPALVMQKVRFYLPN